LEGPVGSIDSNSDWTVFLALGSKIGFRARFDFFISLKANVNTLGLVELAGLVMGNIRIIFFVHEFAILVLVDVSESRCHETTIAATACGNAVDKVLFRKADKFASFSSMATFGGLDGGEGPAGTALSLILDCVNASFVTPVERFSIGDSRLSFGCVVDSLETEHGAVFSWGHSSEIVEGNSESRIASIVFLNKALVGKEDSKTSLVFITSEELIGLAHP